MYPINVIDVENMHGITPQLDNSETTRYFFENRRVINDPQQEPFLS